MPRAFPSRPWCTAAQPRTRGRRFASVAWTSHLPDMIQAKVDAGEPIFISVPACNGREVAPMEVVVLEGCEEKTLNDGRVFLNAKSVRQVKPWTQVVSDKAIMSKEFIPMPIPTAGKGLPFLICSGTPTDPVLVASFPGFRRRIKWNTQNDEPRLEVTFKQWHWNTRSDVREDMPYLTMKMVLWDEQCQQLLLGGKMAADRLRAIVKANPVPFYASVCVDGNYSNDKENKLSLSTLAVHWDLRTYLENSCVELSAKGMQTLVPATTSAKDLGQDIINVSATCKVPLGAKWRYYAMSANCATSLEEVKEPMILYAVQTKEAEAVEAPSESKRQKTGKK